jgi:hypothetical protein
MAIERRSALREQWAVSMGRRNTKLEVYLQECQKAKIVRER